VILSTAGGNLANQTKIDFKSLQKLSILSSIPQVKLEKLAANMDVKTVKGKTKVFDQGDVVGVVYLLISGIVRISWINQARRRVLVTPVSKGEFSESGRCFPRRVIRTAPRPSPIARWE
jgi:hypothetical protein